LSDHPVRVQLLMTSLEASRSDQTAEERNRSLEEQLSSLREENVRLKEAVQEKDSEIQILRECIHLQEQGPLSAIKDRGPLDKQVIERVQTIINLIRLNANDSSNEHFDEASQLPFSEMKVYHKYLYKLHQQAYCFDLDDDITLMHLHGLGIHRARKGHLIRALIGMDILETVFRSSFPDIFHDRGDAAHFYEQILEEQGENLLPRNESTLIRDCRWSNSQRYSQTKRSTQLHQKSRFLRQDRSSQGHPHVTDAQ